MGGVPKHGHKRRGYASPTYISWIGMRTRCTNPKEPGWKNYGGRGITFDPSWNDFAVFLADMGERPPGTSLERKNNDLGYSKDNCKWATRLEQNRNTRKNVRFAGKGVSEIAEERGEMRATVYARLRKYKQVERQPHPQHRLIEFAGETKKMLDWSRDPRCEVDYASLQKRIYAGWDIEKALTCPSRSLDDKDVLGGKTVKQWAAELGVSVFTIYTRLKKRGNVHG